MNKPYITGAIFWSAIAVVALAVWLWGINVPHVGLYNANNNYLSIASENFLRFGYRNLQYLPTYAVSETLPSPVPYYLHHPVLFFLVASVPFALFGSGNWVAHVMTFVYAVSAMVTLYAVIREVSGARIARWSLFFAVLFPMSSFFWKQMFFEQISLYFTLTSLYFVIRYGKTEHPAYLWGLGVSTAMGAASDWYAAYLLVALCVLWMFRRDVRLSRSILVMIAGLSLGFGTYAMALIGTGNIGMVYDGFRARGLASELTGLTWWPARLFMVTVVRLIVYFSPVALIGLWEGMKGKVSRVSGTIGEQGLYRIFFLIGIVNVVILPTATWGHSYFLYYLIPFVAYGMGLWMANVSRKSAIIVCCVILLHVAWSVGVNALKLQQVAKQSWKYAFGRVVSNRIPRYGKVGVLEYPGDVLERYFSIATVAMDASRVRVWASGDGSTDIPLVVMTCAGDCTAGEKEFAASLAAARGGTEYRFGSDIGWIIGGEPAAGRNGNSAHVTPPAAVPNAPASRPSVVLRLYRLLRNALGSAQI